MHSGRNRDFVIRKDPRTVKRKLLSIFCILLWASLLSAASAAPGLAKAEKIFDQDGDRIFENLRERMDRAGAEERLPVVILYKENTPLAGTFAARLNHIRADKVKHTYRNIPAVSASMTPKQIEETRKDPWVEHIEYDARVKAAMNTARASFGVDSVRQQFGFTGNADRIKGNYSKNDIVVAIIDSGVNPSRGDLKKKLLFWKDFVGRGANP
jgi:serine protease AprX